MTFADSNGVPSRRDGLAQGRNGRVHIAGELLSDLGIPVKKDMPGVGSNLQDHLQVRMVYKVNVPTLNDKINNFFRRMLIGMEYVIQRTGPMATGASQVCIFAKTKPELEAPDIQYHF